MKLFLLIPCLIIALPSHACEKPANADQQEETECSEQQDQDKEDAYEYVADLSTAKENIEQSLNILKEKIPISYEDHSKGVSFLYKFENDQCKMTINLVRYKVVLNRGSMPNRTMQPKFIVHTYGKKKGKAVDTQFESDQASVSHGQVHWAASWKGHRPDANRWQGENKNTCHNYSINLTETGVNLDFKKDNCALVLKNGKQNQCHFSYSDFKEASVDTCEVKTVDGDAKYASCGFFYRDGSSDVDDRHWSYDE